MSLTNGTGWSSRFNSVVLLAVVVLVTDAGAQVRPQPPSREQMELEAAERLFDEFQFEPALERLDRLVAMLDVGDPDQSELLARGYELRARARFNLGQTDEATADFEALLRTVPTYRLAEDLSPRLIEAFDAVRGRTVGFLELSMDPPGSVAVDGRALPPMSGLQDIFELTEGPHTLTANLPGYREETREVTIVAGESVAMSLELIRIFGTIEFATDPPGARVFVDDEPQGVTELGPRADGPSLPVIVFDVRPGSHSLRLERDCYQPFEAPFNIPEPPDDVAFGTLELEPAVATAVIATSDLDAVVYLDGERRGPASVPIEGICEGDHLLEVRSPTGRFVDRRTWRPDETVTLDVELRKAFAIIDTDGGSGVLNAELAEQVEEAVGDARGTMIFVPIEAERTVAATAGGSPADPSLTVAQRRTLGEQWAERLGAQGVAWLSPEAAAGDVYRLQLLAAGSGLPDSLPLQLSDLASRASAARALGVAPPPIVRASLEASLVDVEGVTGAAVIRVVSGGTGARAGLAVGDVIVSVDQGAVASAGEVRRALDRNGPAGRLALNVASAQGERAVSVPVAGVPDAIPLSDRSLLSNRLLLDMRDAVAAADTPLGEAAARLNLAIAHIRLTNWDNALRELEQVSLPDGPGVSAGTVAYLTGVCLTEVSQLTAAQEAFRIAVAAVDGQLFIGGPPVAVLAQQRLDEMMR